MQKIVLSLIIGSLATAVFAHAGVKNPAVMARMHAMKDSKATLEVLGGMAKGAVAFDIEKAQQARLDLIAQTTSYVALFKAPESDPKSEALPDIWTDFLDFEKRAETTQIAFENLDVSSLDALRATLGAAAETCSACHRVYRKKVK